jgi:hypothetical protein
MTGGEGPAVAVDRYGRTDPLGSRCFHWQTLVAASKNLTWLLPKVTTVAVHDKRRHGSTQPCFKSDSESAAGCR